MSAPRLMRRLIAVPALALLFPFAGLASAGNPNAPGQQPPTNTSAPSISGSATVGSTLTADSGGWQAANGYAYTWLSCDTSGASCAPIAGATSSTYVVTAADPGHTLRVTVAASNKNGSTSSTSAQTAVVPTPAPAPAPTPTPVSAPANTPTVALPVNSALPLISGVPQASQTLTASVGTWSSTPTSYAYAWQRCDQNGAACALVGGAVSASYVLTSADVGATMRVAVTATNTAGSAVATSLATAVVTAQATVAPSGAFGIAVGGNLQNFNSTDLAHYCDLLQAAHAGWLRFDINWASIQSGGPSSYNWAPFDALVSTAKARGLRLLGTILYTPAWARPSGASSSTPPTNLSDYASFARAAAQHFSTLGVHSYEIWNEPNLAGFWAPGPDPARYTQMLKLAYAAIKGVDPGSTVISAGLAPYGAYGQMDSGHMNPVNFLEQMYANGAHGSMDAVGWHPYNYPYGLGYYVWSAWSQMSETSPSARSLMVANGDGAEQIWPTEFGEPTGSTSNSVSEAVQAQYITDSFAKLKTFTWAGPSFLYSGRDNGTDMSNVENAFGIIRYDWSLKPGYSAFAAAAS